MGARVLNQRLIMLNVPKDVPVKSFKIIYPHTAAAKNKFAENEAKILGVLIKAECS